MRGVKAPLVFFYTEKYMANIGSDKNPIRLGNPNRIKMNPNRYVGEAKKNFDNNWDAIFKKKEKKTTEEK